MEDFKLKIDDLLIEDKSKIDSISDRSDKIQYVIDNYDSIYSKLRYFKEDYTQIHLISYTSEFDDYLKDTMQGLFDYCRGI